MASDGHDVQALLFDGGSAAVGTAPGPFQFEIDEVRLVGADEGDEGNATEGQSWLVAGDVEYRFRVWVIAAIFFAAFELSWWDHVSAAAGLAGLLTRGGGNVHTVKALIFALGAGATLGSCGAAHLGRGVYAQ